ncbi:MAG TPA: gamma carbonic anhydrase family protein [Verrucomicrobiae bacterium]|nr:gamma carbonic anhydrase family protein [Verrucomicrobiae bacterium]
MLIEHDGKRPRISRSAYVASTATICGDVSIGENTCVLFGAIISAEGGPVEIGASCIVMENAVLRGTRRHHLKIGDHVLIGPRASLSGCTVEENVFLATGATVFNGAWIGARAEVRVNGVVHLKTKLPPDSTVPIGWIAVGEPARILPPGAHEEIWAIQKPLNFPKTVFGLERPAEGETIMPELTSRYAAFLSSHAADRIIGGGENK